MHSPRAEDLPVITAETTLRDVAMMLVRDRLIGVIVADETGRPVAVVTALDILGRLVPGFIRDDPALARVYDLAGSSESWREWGSRTIAEIFVDGDDWERSIATVDDDATTIEVAAEMLHRHTSVAAVRPPKAAPRADGPSRRFVTVQTVLQEILEAKGDPVAAPE